MLVIVGWIGVTVMVLGGYMLAGGKMGIILKALPFEMIMIGGAAVGAFLLSNDTSSIKGTLRDLGTVFRDRAGRPLTTAICCAFCSN